MTGSDEALGLPHTPDATSSQAVLSPADAARAAAGKRRKRADRVPDGGNGDNAGGKKHRQGGKPLQEGLAVSPMREAEVRELRRKKGIVGLVLLIFVALSLCTTSSTPALVTPWEVVQCYAIRLQQIWALAFDPVNAPIISDVLQEHPTYYWTLLSLNTTVVTVLSGFLLALSGALYQNVFRNPIAAPSMLGVSSGIQLSVAIIVLVFGTLAGMMVLQIYVSAYVVVTVIIALLFGMTWLMTGKGKPFNVTNMLLVGVILNQFIGVIVTFIADIMLDEESYEIYLSLSSGGMLATEPLTWALLIAGFVIGVVPIVLLRFRMNALSFSPEESRMFGVNPTKLQALALVCGTIAMVTAQIQVGMVAMITLVVPHLSRALFGSEFRKQFVGTMLLGACVLLGCDFIATMLMVPFSDLFPVSVVLNLVLLPAFVWMIATQQRRWD